MYQGSPRPQNPLEFVAMWKQQAQEHFEDLASPHSQSYYGEVFPVEDFSKEQIREVEELMRSVIHESYANLLAGLDGVAVAGVCQKYRVIDEVGNQLVPSPEFTSAWQQFLRDS